MSVLVKMRVKNKTLCSVFVIGGFLIGTLLVITTASCQKNTTCKAVITVVDTLNRPLNNALVALMDNEYLPGKTNTVTTQTTNINGVASFSFPQNAIYNVNITYKNIADSAVGIIRLSPGGTVSGTYTWR